MKLGIMCSGNGTNFENIVRTCKDSEVVLMIYNKEECGAKEKSIKMGIPHCYLKSIEESEIIRRFAEANVDLIVLAGWMRIVTKNLLDAFPMKIINIHPSLLPKYKGINAIQQALDSGDVLTGCTVHYVTEELDSGKIIEQEKVPILPTDTLETLTQRVHRAEHYLLPKVINNFQSPVAQR